jgi:dephospho-CoA kinase
MAAPSRSVGTHFNGGDVITIGLTGGIGSGKSVVAEMLAARGAAVVNADHVGHETYRRGTESHLRIVSAFGPEIVGPDGEIDRAKLGRRVFQDSNARRRLQSIVWPAMRRMMKDRLDELRDQGAAVAVLEAAVLIEADWLSLVDEVWLVSASKAAVRQRLVEIKGLTPDEAEARVNAQISDDERRRHAKAVIENSGTLEELEREVDRLWSDLERRVESTLSRRGADRE